MDEEKRKKRRKESSKGKESRGDNATRTKEPLSLDRKDLCECDGMRQDSFGSERLGAKAADLLVSRHKIHPLDLLTPECINRSKEILPFYLLTPVE